MTEINLLDSGYVRLVETYGSDQSIIEAARMSTNKGFKEWGPIHAADCAHQKAMDKVESDRSYMTYLERLELQKTSCTCTPGQGDEKLLAFLYNNKHMTPFEMAGMIIEVKAPIFVFREWHRHRTQSYNEMSARYTPLPDENYLPTMGRIVEGARATGNKQAQGISPLDVAEADRWLANLRYLYQQIESVYQDGLRVGIPKELARLPVPVARYSRMRASSNLRNWLAFMTLRQAPNAQWEIRQYANAVAQLVEERFPRTFELYVQGGSRG